MTIDLEIEITKIFINQNPKTGRDRCIHLITNPIQGLNNTKLTPINSKLSLGIQLASEKRHFSPSHPRNNC